MEPISNHVVPLSSTSVLSPTHPTLSRRQIAINLDSQVSDGTQDGAAGVRRRDHRVIFVRHRRLRFPHGKFDGIAVAYWSGTASTYLANGVYCGIYSKILNVKSCLSMQHSINA